MKLLLFALLVVAVSSYKEEMLESNRIPQAAVAAFGDTCGECKSMVKRFEEALEDPQKLAELKMLLGALCHETSYAEECRLIVAKLDIILAKLEPYLRDSEKVCKAMRLCHNPKITKFHRLGLLYLKNAMSQVDGKNDLVCDECQLAAIEVKKVVDDQQKRQEIKQFLSQNVCKHIPKYSGACDLMLDETLPELFQELDALLANPKGTCQQIGFCPREAGKLTKFNKNSPKQTLSTFWKKSKEITMPPGGIVLVSCFECKVAMDTLLMDLKQQDKYTAIGYDLRDFACPILPDNMLAGCEDFLTMYAPTVVYMTLMQMDPALMCSRVKMCDKPSLVAMQQLSKEQIEGAKCEACEAFSAFMKYELTQPDFKTDLVSGVVSNVCTHARSFANLCENFAESFVPKMVDKAVELVGERELCKEELHVC